MQLFDICVFGVTLSHTVILHSTQRLGKRFSFIVLSVVLWF